MQALDSLFRLHRVVRFSRYNAQNTTIPESRVLSVPTLKLNLQLSRFHQNINDAIYRNVKMDKRNDGEKNKITVEEVHRHREIRICGKHYTFQR